MRSLGEAAGPLEASIFVEALRSFPATFLAIALFVHAMLWAIATQIAEPSPPPQMAVALALGHEWMSGYSGLPPLTAWVSEAIYRATHSLFVLRLAAAFCVAGAGWIIFLFARRIVGDRHGVIAVLLMVSVFPVAFPGGSLTGELLQMPLAATAILAWWIAVNERNPNAWIVVSLMLGVMIHAGPQALVLLVVLIAVTLTSTQARAAINRLDARLCIALALLIFSFIAGPRILWLWQNGAANIFAGEASGIAPNEMQSPLRLPFTLIAGHFGLGLILFLASAYAAKEKETAPVFVREEVSLFSRKSVIVFAVAPALLALLLLYGFGQPSKPQFFAPLLMLSGLAAIILGGNRLIIRRQRLVGAVALIFLFAPSAMQIVLSFAPGWFSDNKTTNWPGASIARTFTEIFHTRTNRPLQFVVGERVSSAQIAALSPDRPHVFIDADSSRAPWIDNAEFKKQGGVVFWEIRGADQAPPADYVAKLPAFTPEAPLRLPWARGGGDPVRLGWAIVPPQ
jgi:4-amino-4-deoxy-L-arabinose transferase-like glycosyltransferase